MQEKRFVEVGRVVHVTTGPHAGSVGAIVDIIDAKRLLVDGPKMSRVEIKIKDMFLTRILLKIEKACRQTDLYAKWQKFGVDQRYKNTEHAKRLDKKAKRAAMTDFEYFKVRTASREINKIRENCIKNLREKMPRAMAKMERSRRVNMGVKLGYRVEKKLTPEEKATLQARNKQLRDLRKKNASQAYALKKEKRAQKSQARKARLVKRKAETDPEKKFHLKPSVPKEKRFNSAEKRKQDAEKGIVQKAKTVPHVSSVKAFRRARDVQRKEAKQKRVETTQALQKNRKLIKEAKAKKTKAPRPLKSTALPAF